MMKRIFLIIPILIPGVFALNWDVPVDRIHYEIIDYAGAHRIMLTDGADIGRPGAPALPFTVFSLILPDRERIASVTVLEAEYQTIPGPWEIVPEQEALPMDQPPQLTDPDTLIYHSSSAYPATPVLTYHSGNMRGIAIGQVSVVPFVYEPLTGHLSVLKKLRLGIETRTATAGVKPDRQSQLSADIFGRLLRVTVPDQPVVMPAGAWIVPGDPAPTELPSLLGSPVDLLIITTDGQYGSYQKYADFRKKFGFLTTVRTMSWIIAHYNGMDEAECIRLFIRDAVEQWGVSYVLLGGDVPGVPTRIVWMQPLVGPWPTHIATDLYFSDLDGSWNFDGDDRFGEVEDSLDLYPDVLVGRLPTRVDSDLISYKTRVNEYLMPQETFGYDRALFVSADWWSQGDARAAASRLAQHVPNNFDTCFIHEAGLPEFKDSLSSRWGMIGILAHGDVNLLRIRADPRTFATNFFFDSLIAGATNHPLMWAITCYSNPYQLDALGEHWVLNRTAGGIGYLGPSYSSSAGDHEAYMGVMLDSLFSLPMAGALAYSKVFWIPQSIYWDNWKRSFQFSLNLLADPTITLWDTIPRVITPVLVDHDTIDIGIDTLTISIAFRVNFTTLLYKPNDLFVKDSGCSMVQAVVKTNTTGWLYYTILTPGFISYTDSIYVRAQRPHLVICGTHLHDSLGIPNGIINPGEEIRLFVNIANTGSDTARSLGAIINCDDTLITITQDSAAYPDIDPGGAAENAVPFQFKVSAAIPDSHDLIFSINITGAGFDDIDSCQLFTQAPDLEHFSQQYSWRGDTVSFILQLENRGHQTADSVLAFISALSDTVEILDSTVCFPPLIPGLVTGSTPDSFIARQTIASRLQYRLRVFDHGFCFIDRIITQSDIPPLDTLWTEGLRDAVVTRWHPVTGIIGYRLYRSPDPGGPFTWLGNPLDPISYFRDENVDPVTDYWYYVRAVDESRHEGPASDTMVGRTNPRLAQGWPQVMRGWCFSSPNFGDLDPGYPGLEIVVGGKDGCLYGWHCDGTPLVGDGTMLITNGQIWSSPAVGDVNHDGQLEIAVGIRNVDPDNFYVLDNQGSPLPGWPKDLEWGVLTSPVLSDIDGDGCLEIFIISESSKLYAFRFNGEGLFNDTCVFKQLYGGSFGVPAIGDINRDGALEIVCHGGEGSDSLFVWDNTGQNLPPFPIAVCSRMRYSPVLGDVCGDGDLEICFYTDSTECLNVVDCRGHLVWQRSFSLDDVEAGPIIADITGSDRPEIVCGNNLGLIAFDSAGTILPGFPLYNMEHNWKLPVAADMDGDSAMDIASGSSEWNLYAHRGDGSQLTGFPIPMGSGVECSPGIADIDGDQKLELMCGDNGFSFSVFDLEGTAWEWPKYRYDQYNTGCYQSGNWHGIRSGLSRPADQARALNALPNPFRDRLMISCRVEAIPPVAMGDEARHFELKIYDVSGRLVRDLSSLVSATNQGGSLVIWDSTDKMGLPVPAGVYFLTLNTPAGRDIRKIIRVK